MRIDRQKLFGKASMNLGVLSPGAYNGKELAKLESNDEAEYKKKRYLSAAKGFFAPTSAAVLYDRAAKMAEEGYTPEEIKKEVGDISLLGLAEKPLTIALARRTNYGGLVSMGSTLNGQRVAISHLDDESRLKAKERTKHYSDSKKDNEKEKLSKGVNLGIGMTAAGIGTNIAGVELLKRQAKKSDEKLLKNLVSQNPENYYDLGGEPLESFAVRLKHGKSELDKDEDLKKKLEKLKGEKDPEKVRKVIEDHIIEKKKNNSLTSFKSEEELKKLSRVDKVKRDLILGAHMSTNNTMVYGSKTGNPAILAHEIGHTKNLNGKGSALGNLLHKDAAIVTNNIGRRLSPLVSGYYSGKRQANLEREGKSQSKKERIAFDALGAAPAMGTIGAEIAADRQGLKLYKAAGGKTGKFMKAVTPALGTYMGIGVMDAGTTEIARAATLGVLRNKQKLEKLKNKGKKKGE